MLSGNTQHTQGYVFSAESVRCLWRPLDVSADDSEGRHPTCLYPPASGQWGGPFDCRHLLRSKAQWDYPASSQVDPDQVNFNTLWALLVTSCFSLPSSCSNSTLSDWLSVGSALWIICRSWSILSCVSTAQLQSITAVMYMKFRDLKIIGSHFKVNKRQLLLHGQNNTKGAVPHQCTQALVPALWSPLGLPHWTAPSSSPSSLQISEEWHKCYTGAASYTCTTHLQFQLNASFFKKATQKR